MNAPAPTGFQRQLASTAHDQYEQFHLLRENQPPLSTQIERYWADLGFVFPGVGVAWSAVFVSWCVKTAGATAAQFHFSAAHSEFVYEAIQNQLSQIGVFRCHRPQDHAPKVGDILQNNRGTHSFDYAYARAHRHYESHSTVVVEVGVDNAGHYLRTIGGNESDSVGLKEVRLLADGTVANAAGLYISVIETLL